MLFLAPNGSDGGSCSSTSPCLTFDRAYHAAAPGQTVQVGAGTYPVQRMSRDASKIGEVANVVFQSAPGELAVLAGIVGDDISHVTFLGNSSRDLAPPHSGLTLKSQPLAMDTGGDFTVQNCSSYVTVHGVDMRQFAVNGSDHITIDGGSVGGYDNSGGDSFVGGPYQGRGTSTCTAENPSNILLTHLIFHDVQRTNLPSAHPDCLQFYGTASTIIDGNSFVRCGTSNIIARPNVGSWAGNTIDSLVIQNNFFTPSVEGGAVMVLGAHDDVCGRFVVDYNTSTADALSAFDCAKYASLEIVGNYQHGQTQYACDQILKKATMYAYNVIGFAGGPRSATSCGEHSATIGDPAFVSAGDSRVSSNSSLTDRGSPTIHPSVDINGRPRPIRAAPDAGAYEWDVPQMNLGTSIGYAKIKMARSVIDSYYGTPRRVARSSDFAAPVTVATYPVHGGVLQVFFDPAGLAIGLRTTSPYYTSAGGIGAGAAVSGYSLLGHSAWDKCRNAFMIRSGQRNVYFAVSSPRARTGKIVSIAYLPRRLLKCQGT
jgi:hypothetical protein